MEVRIIPVPGLPEVAAGTDLGAEIAAAIRQQGLGLENGDVVVVTQKIVSKAEGRLVEMTSLVPSPFAREVAARTEKEPELVEAILQESARMVRMAGGVLIMETKHGFVCANAGVDQSNVDGQLCLLPIDPDASAGRIREQLMAEFGAEVAVVISDTFGRPWRMGQTNVAIGLSGMLAVTDYRGTADDFGRELKVTEIAVADELAAAAELVMGKVSRVPVAIVRGYAYPRGNGSSRDLVRPAEKDLFR